VALEQRSDDRPLRRDAERNRQRILDAAGRLIGDRGLEVSHDEIAREANVGVGTVYRRFPTRERLFDALYHRELDTMVAIAEKAAQVDDPLQGLRLFLERSFEQQAANRGLRELLIGHSGTTDLARSAQSRIGPIVGGLVVRAQAEGRLHPAIGPTDTAMIPVMINAVMRASREADPDQWRRWLAILLEGMAVGRRRKSFPGHAPSPSEVERIIGGRSEPPATSATLTLPPRSGRSERQRETMPRSTPRRGRRAAP